MPGAKKGFMKKGMRGGGKVPGMKKGMLGGGMAGMAG